jgi:thiol-disulfide isomerase/thioredoxin
MLRLSWFLLLISACLALRAQPNRKLPAGPWRAELNRPDGAQIVFNFEVTDSLHRRILYVRNGAERLLVDSIRLQDDSVWIRMPFFESQIRAAFDGPERLRGVWIKRLEAVEQRIPFQAFHGQTYRFRAVSNARVADLHGRWAVHFQNDSLLSIGEFVQHGRQLTGTFLNPTGDYRYLQGIVDGDSLKMSCFDGGHAYLFLARLTGNGSLNGRYYSGLRFNEPWTGTRDPSVHLPDEFSLTRMKPGQKKLQFSFLDIDSQRVSLADPWFRGKVVLLQIMGSWCPNCMDETRFLSSFYDRYHARGLEIVGLAYERSSDFARSQASLRSFQQRFAVKYPLLITGVTDSDPRQTEKTLPGLEKIEGFPTTIFINRKGEVEKIQTGFNGPATGEHYEQEKKLFAALVGRLLAE